MCIIKSKATQVVKEVRFIYMPSSGSCPKSGLICAQLLLSVPQFYLRRYLSTLHFRYSFIVFTSPARSLPSFYFPFHTARHLFFNNFRLGDRGGLCIAQHGLYNWEQPGLHSF
jgi:hypothetical protein